MKKLLVLSIIFLSLEGTNCNATTVNIADILDFKGSTIINNKCLEFYKYPYMEKYYYLVKYQKDGQGFYRKNFISKNRDEITKKSLKNIDKNQLCYERR
jgi:hypothetical protein